jgi:hypothetical protein
MSSSDTVSPNNDDKWKIEDAVRTLIRAEEIKRDKDLMEKLRPELEKQKVAIERVSSLKELRSLASKKSLEEKEDGDR